MFHVGICCLVADGERVDVILAPIPTPNGRLIGETFLKKIGFKFEASGCSTDGTGTTTGVTGIETACDGETDELATDGAVEKEELGEIDADGETDADSEIPIEGDALPDGDRLALGESEADGD